jgi:hypothetical protein
MTSTPSSPKMPEPLKVVAWCYYDGERDDFPSGPYSTIARSTLLAFDQHPHCRNETPLARLSDAQASIQALEAVKQAIRDYHYALDTRQHGGVAQDRAFSAICSAMGMHWVSGNEKEYRAAIDAARAAQEVKP